MKIAKMHKNETMEKAMAVFFNPQSIKTVARTWIPNTIAIIPSL